MDDTEKHLSTPESSIKNSTTEDLTSIKLIEDFHSNYLEANEARDKSWSTISKIKSHTSVLIYIHNGTQETFSLANSSWDSSKFPLESHDIPPAQYMAFTLRSAPPRRISNGKSSFQSSAINHNFTYKSGDYAFNFTALLKLQLTYDAFSFSSSNHTLQREFSTRSIGNKKLICLTDIDRHLSTSPYSHIITINLRT